MQALLLDFISMKHNQSKCGINELEVYIWVMFQCRINELVYIWVMFQCGINELVYIWVMFQ